MFASSPDCTTSFHISSHFGSNCVGLELVRYWCLSLKLVFFSVYFAVIMYSCRTVPPWKGQYSRFYAADTHKTHCPDGQYIIACRDQSPSYSVPAPSVYQV